MTQGQEAANPQVPEQVTGQGQAQSPESQEPAPQETVEEFLARTNFKSLADAEKSFKEAQAKITKVSQEKAQLEQALQANSYSQSQTQPPQKQSSSGQGTDFYDDPEGHVARLARQIASEEIGNRFQQLEARQAIEKVRSENPARFDALRPAMQQIYIEKPYLNNMQESGLRQAMEEAATRRQQELEVLKAEMFPDQTNTNNDQPNLKEQARQEVLSEMSRNQQATIPQGGASRPISDDTKKKMAELTKKGDVDALLDLKISSF